VEEEATITSAARDGLKQKAKKEAKKMKEMRMRTRTKINTLTYLTHIFNEDIFDYQLKIPFFTKHLALLPQLNGAEIQAQFLSF
jgi:hypothetical protein